MTRNQVDDERITAIGLFAEAYTGLTARIAVQVSEHGLAPTEFEVLIRLARSPERQLRMSDLAAQTTLTTSGVTRVIDRLEREGLVRRHACERDRRAMYAVLTTAGTEKVDTVIPGHVALIDQWFTGRLDPERLAAFLEALRVLRDAVRPGAVAGGDSEVPRAVPSAA